MSLEFPTPDVLRFEPALPCRCFEPNIEAPNFGHCGKPATVGSLVPVGLGFQILPICKECVGAIMQLYPEEAPHA
jgi:hypothetical protein